MGSVAFCEDVNEGQYVDTLAFGVSVVEAMSYGCIPVVFNAYALPEIVGRNGYIVCNFNDTDTNP